MVRNATVFNSKIVIKIITYNVLITLYGINMVISSETDLKGCKQDQKLY